jgi:3-hydroxyisobutyrate dehydrogenase-like beta-hydroxyacid dehydrogenase
MKLVNNVISARVRAITFEASAMGIKNGLNVETCTPVLQKGSARSATIELASPKLLKGDFSVSFTLASMHKDARLATRLGNDSATPMVLPNVVHELFQTAINEHGADKDTLNLVKLFEPTLASPSFRAAETSPRHRSNQEFTIELQGSPRK